MYSLFRGSPPSPVHVGGSGPPLLLVHGLGATWRTFDPILPLLEPDFTVFAPTVPGHWGALPSHPSHRATPQANADEVERWLDHYRLDRVSVAGHSLGAWTAVELARRGRCEDLILLAPAGAWRSHAVMVKTFAGLLAAHVTARLAAPCAPRLMHVTALRRAYFSFLVREGRNISEADAALEVRAAAYCSVVVAALRTLARAELGTPWHDHEKPVHVVMAGDDRLLPFEQFGAPLLEIVEPVELVMLPEAGHMIYRDAPAQVAELIRGAVLHGRMPRVDVRANRERGLRSVPARKTK